MNYYKATLQYDGSLYFGFQWQKDIPSIQNDFNLALEKLIEGKLTTMGSSRTDTGVHAFEQVVRITSAASIDCVPLLYKLNSILPPPIRCLNLLPCKSTFRPVTDSLSKEYRYFFTNTKKLNTKDRKYIANNPYPLNIAAMKSCAEKIVGLHDFHNFCSAGSNVKTTIREIIHCELSEIDPSTIFSSCLFEVPQDLSQCYQFKIVGKGFLKQMVRHLMSALWMVGSGRLTQDEFLTLIEGPAKEKRLWKVAHSTGLFLYKITYSP